MEKVLIVDDDAVTAVLLKKMLEKEGFQVILAENGKEGLKAFAENQKDISLIITDWLMPEMDGLEMCQKIRQMETEHYVYVIFLSAKENKQDIVAGLKAGADDYLTKPFSHEELIARVNVGLRIVRLQQELKKANHHLEILATTDMLTGVLNRRALRQRLIEELERCARKETSLCLFMADLDHFKKINDTYGHLVGDKVLQEVVKRLKQNLRPYDIIGRYGGEEFVIGIPEICYRQIIRDIAERIRQSVANTPIIINDTELKVTISIGGTVAKPRLEDNMEAYLEKLLKKADDALYEAKQKGRNRVIIAGESNEGAHR